MGRVAALMDAWAAGLGLDARERMRWRAAAWLHDVLRDADPARLRASLGGGHAEWPSGLLHGPAAAARLAEEGVTDQPLLNAVAWHTLGHPDLDLLGRCLYVADYIEPGRTYEPGLLAVLRARMPAAAADVVREVARRRISRLLESGRPIAAETAAFWNSVAGG